MSDPHRLHETRLDGRGVDPVGAFRLNVSRAASGVLVIGLGGELDMAAAPAVRARVDAAVGERGLVIDLAEVTFVDSSMLKELLRANLELGRYETPLVLAGIAPAVRRLLDLTRTAQLFTIAEDRPAALALLGRED